MNPNSGEASGTPDPPELVPFLLTKTKRVLIAIGAFTLAVLHQFYALDVVTLTLLGISLVVLFLKIEKINFAGVEGRLAEEIDKVEHVTLPVPPQEPPIEPPVEAGAVEHVKVEDVARVELREVRPVAEEEPFLPSEPGELLIWTTSRIAEELLVLAGNSGQAVTIPDTFPRLTHVPTFASYLVSRNIIPETLLSGIVAVTRARNEFVHGALSKKNIETAAALGARVLDKLRELGRYWYRVRAEDVPLYEDKARNVPHPTRGVMIVTLTHDGEIKGKPKVYPYEYKYTLGRFVTWEWNMRRAFQHDAWFEDPETGESVLAFNSAATFAGRQYPDAWRLESRFVRPDVGLEPMDIQQKMNLIAEHLKEQFSDFTLEHVGDIFDTGNHFVRFYRSGQGLRIEFTRVLLEDFSAYAIIDRLRTWTPPPASEGSVAVCVYSDRIDKVPWDRSGSSSR